MSCNITHKEENFQVWKSREYVQEEKIEFATKIKLGPNVRSVKHQHHLFKL